MLLLGGASYSLVLPPAALAQGPDAVTRIAWADMAAIRPLLERERLTEAGFPSYVAELRRNNAARVREGDLDHLVFYLLQSARFTSLAAIEPALSARILVEGLDAAGRDAFFRDPQTAVAHVDAAVRARVAAMLAAVGSTSRDPRLTYFRELISNSFRDRNRREAGLVAEYLRVMRFVYEKEFVAQRAKNVADAVADLYRSRGLSTDTAVEAGYVVHLGLAVVKSLDPDFRVRRALIVGPGLDLAPRTALNEEAPPESYQPWAVMDALVALGLSRVEDLDLAAADINPRVVDHLKRAQAAPPVLTLVSEIRDSETVMLSDEYRAYFGSLGRAIGDAETATTGKATATGVLRKTVRVAQPASRALRAVPLDIVTERLDVASFDLIVATNILPYFGDAELGLALTNIASMLAPGGMFLHNEARPLVGDLTTALDVPFVQSRHATIATVKGAPAPLFDSVWLHRKVR